MLEFICCKTSHNVTVRCRPETIVISGPLRRSLGSHLGANLMLAGIARTVFLFSGSYNTAKRDLIILSPARGRSKNKIDTSSSRLAV